MQKPLQIVGAGLLLILFPILLYLNHQNGELGIGGSICEKEGFINSFGGKQYICSKLGDSLFWMGMNSSNLVPHNQKHGTSQNANSLVSDFAFKSEKFYPRQISHNLDIYRCLLINPKLNEDLNVNYVSIVAMNEKISHHVSLLKISNDLIKGAIQIDNESRAPGWPCFGDTSLDKFTTTESKISYLQLWAPGTKFYPFPENTSFHIEKGSAFVLVVHTYGAELNDSAEFEIEFLRTASKLPQYLENLTVVAPIELPCLKNESGPLCNRQNSIKRMRQLYGDKHILESKNLSKSCPVTETMKRMQSAICSITIENPALLVSVQPHMHLLGKKFQLFHISGSKKTIVSIRQNWSFHRQTIDWFETPIKLSRGDKLEVRCVFDRKKLENETNYSDSNSMYVLYGPSSSDEMCQAFTNLVKIA